MSRTITDSNIEKKGKKFHASAEWRDDHEGGTEYETFNSFDEATAWINKLEAESDSGAAQETPAGTGSATPPVPVPGQENNPDDRGDLSHSPAAAGHTPSAVPTATDKDTIPEPAASDMNPADAENINANINPAPVPAGAEQGGLFGDPFSNPLEGQTAADTQPAPTDNENSNEVNGVQDPNATPSNSAQQSESDNTSDDNTNTAKTASQS